MLPLYVAIYKVFILFQHPMDVYNTSLNQVKLFMYNNYSIIDYRLLAADKK